MYRAAVIAKTPDGGINGVSSFVGAPTNFYPTALKNAEDAVRISGYNEAVVLQIVATVKVRRDIILEESEPKK